MKRFYMYIEIYYRIDKLEFQGNVFTGVSFKDSKNNEVESRKEHFLWDEPSDDYLMVSSETSKLCGIRTENFSEWISVGGPIKGSYAIKNGEDQDYDYISDFGMRVEDPCQAVDDKLNIKLTPSYTTVKDLKYHNGTDSQFWLPKVC